MEHKENSYTVLKKHESPMESSIHGKMTELLQLCQDKNTQAHYFSYEVLDSEGGIIGGRLIYEFKDPNKALKEWEKYINEDLKPSEDFVVHKKELPNHKTYRF